MTEAERAAVNAFRDRALRTRGGQCVIKLRGWGFIMDQDVAGLPGKHFSAQLIPKGRGSTVDDWHFLMEVLALVGAPSEPLVPFASVDASDVHHWHWDAPDEVIECMRQVASSRAFADMKALIGGARRRRA
jgi:hypothetical protein